MPIIPIRLLFKKEGRLKFISHLDTMSLLTKAINRSGIPVWYTEGYNPHIYLTILLPLSLGYEGRQEYFDIRLTEEMPFEEIVDKINKNLPEQLCVLEAFTPILDSMEIAWADYEIIIYQDEASGLDILAQKLEEYVNQKEILVDKKSKKGLKKVDIAPYIKHTEVSLGEKAVSMGLMLAAGGDFNVNPRLILEGFASFSGQELDDVSVSRKKIFDKNEKEFR